MKFLNNISQYVGYYDEGELKSFMKATARKLGKYIAYYVMIMVTLIGDPTVPNKAKLTFMAAIGYLILPTDLVADILPFIGFTDDIAFLTYVISSATDYITPGIKDEARVKLKKWLSIDIEDADIIEEESDS
jgi:uncharacterized membrane protein YkvA (DUF1232 family)